MENNNPDIQEIIIRHLQRQTSQPEEEQLAAWVDASPQNKAGFEEVKRIWGYTNQEADAFSPDTSAAWEKVKRQTIAANEKLGSGAGRVVKMPVRVRQLAASVALLFVVGYLFLFAPGHTESWTTVASAGEKKHVFLPDSSTVWLNKNSTLSWSDFEGESREVKLVGEAFFEVRRKPAQPFRIEGSQSITEVLGTSFNLTSIPGKMDVVEVVTGLVTFSSTHHPEVRLRLTPGKSGKIAAHGVAEEALIENQNFRAWQSEQLSFDNTPLPEVGEELERYFGVTVQIQDSALNRCRFTGSFHKPKLNDVLQVLSLSANVQVVQKEDGYHLSGDGCR